VKLAIRVHEAQWRTPLAAAHGAAAERRPLVLVSLQNDAGVRGWGEAAPLHEYDGVKAQDVLAALEACRGELERMSGADLAAVRCSCAELTTVPQALAAIDLALWDLAGRASGEPIWRMLGAVQPPVVPVNATIGALGPEAAAGEARAAVAAGFSALKLKVGLGDDIGRIRAVRQAVGPEVALRVDANGAWGASYTAEMLAAVADQAIECCEEPAHGWQLLQALSDVTPVPIAADESVADPELLAQRVCTAVCLKVAAAGGITGLVRDAAAARAVGYEVYLASTLDGPLGIAAALHAAAAVSPDRFCGLATLDRFTAADPIGVSGGLMSPPPGPGLGDGLIDWYA
jgi:L-alanine-DL-glutamate epimerase-like enolase superfamily enzyme